MSSWNVFIAKIFSRESPLSRKSGNLSSKAVNHEEVSFSYFARSAFHSLQSKHRYCGLRREVVGFAQAGRRSERGAAGSGRWGRRGAEGSPVRESLFHA